MTDSETMNRMVTGTVEAPGRWDDRIASRIGGGVNSDGASCGVRGMITDLDVLSVNRSAVRASRPAMIDREWMPRVAAFKNCWAGETPESFRDRSTGMAWRGLSRAIPDTGATGRGTDLIAWVGEAVADVPGDSSRAGNAERDGCGSKRFSGRPFRSGPIRLNRSSAAKRGRDLEFVQPGLRRASLQR